jgi:hypothetical protein
LVLRYATSCIWREDNDKWEDVLIQVKEKKATGHSAMNNVTGEYLSRKQITFGMMLSN